ncbi:unnamed protein product [Sphagnum troendelagicum]|uniref:DNA polymerase V n=1 Tax=Sphagnum troendelagicum TaxID=128251 RepID=A0ABP0UEP6_9BRYO
MGKRNRSEGRTAAPSTPSISTFAAEEAEPSTSAVPLVVPQKKKLKKLKKSPVEANVTAVQEGDNTAEPSTSVPAAAAVDDDDDDDGPQKKVTKERNYGIETKETAMEGDKAGNSEMARLADSSSACPEPVGMQIYWNLSSVNACVREAAAVALAKELESDQQEFEAGGRQEGAAEEVLGAVKDVDGALKGCAPSVRYAVRRLVRGLGSARESARQGFALALTTLMCTLPVIHGDAVMQLIESILEVTSAMKGQDARDGRLGRLFAYGALVRAERVIGDATTSGQQSIAKDITQNLLMLANKKIFLREPAMIVIIELVRQVPLDAFEASVCAAPLFQEWLQREPESQNADGLLLALKLHEKIPVMMRHSCLLLPSSGILQDFFQPSHLNRLVPCLMEASVSHPRVHSVWPVLLDLLLPESVQSAQLELKKSPKKSKKKTIGPSCQKDLDTMKAHLSTFWSIIVDGALLPSSHERKHLAMELVLLFLPRLPDPTFVDIVLSNTFVRCILTILSDKDTLLHKSALRCLGEIRTWAEKDDVHRVAAIMALQKSSYCKFDVLSKTSTVKILTSGLKSEANVVAFVLTLEDLFQSGESHMVTSARSGSEALIEGKKEGDTSILMNDPKKGQGYEEQDMEGSFASVGKAGDRERVWILEQICALSEQTQLEPTAARVTLFKEVLSFLVLHAIFDAKHKEAATGKGMALKWPQLPLSERIRSLCVARLRSVLVSAQNWALAQRLNDNQLVSGGKSKEQRPQDQHVSDPANFALFVTQFCESIQRLPAVYLARPLTKDDADAVEKLRGTVSQLSSALKGVEGDDQAEKLLAMRSLLLQLLLESFLEPGSVSGSAVDLAICCRKAFPGISAEVTDNLQQDSNEMPPVMDVLVDIILSLLAQSSLPVRAAAEQVFKTFCGDLTRSGMENIFRIIKKGTKSVRHKPVVELDEEGSEEDDDMLGLHDDEGSEEEAGSEDDNDDEVEEVEEIMGHGGEHANDSMEDGGSDSEMSDMDDEAMFRIDVHLARMLKQRKAAVDGGSKDVQTQLLHFKFRVLSLLELFLQKHPGSPLALIAMPGLLQAFVGTIRQLGTANGDSQLVDRIEQILRSKLLKSKKYPSKEEVQIPAAKELLKKTLKLAARSMTLRVRTLAQACALWVLKVLQGSTTDAEDIDADVLQILAMSLEDSFVQKKSRLSVAFFRNIFQQHPWLGRAVLGQLIDKCGNARSEFFKREAMHMVTEILRRNMGKDKKAGHCPIIADVLQPFLPTLSGVLLSLVQKPPVKKEYKSEAFKFCYTSIEALRTLYPSKPLSALLDTEALLVSLKDIKLPPMGKLQHSVTRSVSLIEKEMERVSMTGKKESKMASKKENSSPINRDSTLAGMKQVKKIKRRGRIQGASIGA